VKYQEGESEGAGKSSQKPKIYVLQKFKVKGQPVNWGGWRDVANAGTLGTGQKGSGTKAKGGDIEDRFFFGLSGRVGEVRGGEIAFLKGKGGGVKAWCAGGGKRGRGGGEHCYIAGTV